MGSNLYLCVDCDKDAQALKSQPISTGYVEACYYMLSLGCQGRLNLWLLLLKLI